MADVKPRVRIGADGSNARLVGALPARPGTSAAYMRGEASPFFFSWRPALREPRDDVRAAWSAAASRAIDALHNSGWLSGAVEQAVAMTVGPGLKLNAAPDYEALGWKPDAAAEWARTVERRWEAWADNPIECDMQGRMTVGQMTAAALRSWFGYGEIVAQLPWHRRSISTTRTKVLMLPPSRLVPRDEAQNMVQGVRLDATGLPIGYVFKTADPRGYEHDVEIRARDSVGRPQVVHVFDGAPGQVRGITPLAPALLVVRQFDQLANATLTAALIQAIFAATVESASPSEEMLRGLQDDAEQGVGGGNIDDYLGAKANWYQGTKIDLGNHGKIAHLFPGEKLSFHGSEHPNTTYEPFARFLLREVARCIGVTFEQLTGDYTGATYSSVRMATSEVWQIVQYRRKNICGRFVQPIYEAWLEEEIDTGRIAFPGGLEAFLDQRSAASACYWRGPAKPQADDFKFAKAAETLMKLGVVPMESVCAELGHDWNDVIDQIARERAYRAKAGVPEPQFGSQPSGAAAEDAGSAEGQPAGGRDE